MTHFFFQSLHISLKYTWIINQSDQFVNQHVGSRNTSGVDFSFIPFVEHKIPGRVHPPSRYDSDIIRTTLRVWLI